MNNSPKHFLGKRRPVWPAETFAPIAWRTEELAQLRLRVQELMAGGLRRSEASTVAFAELVTRRALERAQAETSCRIRHDLPEPPEAA